MAMIANFVLETSTAPGTATTINLAGAPTGRRTFAQAFASGTAVFYFMDDGTQAEWGWGVFTSGSPNTLTRTTVDGNSAGTTVRLNFAGVTRVYNDVPANRVPYIDSSTKLVTAAANFAIDATGNLTVTGAVKGASHTCHAGTAGAYSPNGFNINWTGSAAQLWIDATNLGTISTVSDARYKQAIADIPGGALDRIMSLRPVSYRWQNIPPFLDNGIVSEGFLAQEVLPVIPSAVFGTPEDSGLMSLEPMALIAHLTKAVQELAADFAAYKAAHP